MGNTGWFGKCQGLQDRAAASLDLLGAVNARVSALSQALLSTCCHGQEERSHRGPHEPPQPGISVPGQRKLLTVTVLPAAE